MEVYLLRHGIAENRRPGRADSERKLTDEGKAKLRLVLARAQGAVGQPSLILTSPLVRAVETAEVAAEALGYAGAIAKTNALLPSYCPQEVWREIRSHSGARAILLAGHEPLLSQTASYLLGASRLMVDFKKGALMRVDIDEVAGAPRGVLQWMLTPRLAGA